MSYPVPVVAAVVCRKGAEVLLVADADGWRVPAAPLAGGQSWWEGVQAVVAPWARDELRGGRLLGVYSDPSLWETPGGHRLAVAFLLEEDEGQRFTVGDGARWFSAKELPEGLSAADRVLVQDGTHYRNRPAVR